MLLSGLSDKLYKSILHAPSENLAMTVGCYAQAFLPRWPLERVGLCAVGLAKELQPHSIHFCNLRMTGLCASGQRACRMTCSSVFLVLCGLLARICGCKPQFLKMAILGVAWVCTRNTLERTTLRCIEHIALQLTMVLEDGQPHVIFTTTGPIPVGEC